MLQARAGHTATLLKDGRVLIAGGFDVTGRALRTTEYFDPAANTFSAGPELTTARAAHAAARMGDRVVVVGGTSMSRALSSTDVLSHGTWQPGPTLMVGRVKHAALGLKGGELFVIGGSPTVEGEVLLDSTELVDLDSGRVSAGPRLSEGEYKPEDAVAALPDGRVVIAGGHRVDVYDPTSRSMTVLEHPALPRLSFRTVSVLDAHTVLLAGGVRRIHRPDRPDCGGGDTVEAVEPGEADTHTHHRIEPRARSMRTAGRLCPRSCPMRTRWSSAGAVQMQPHPGSGRCLGGEVFHRTAPFNSRG